MKKKSTFSLIDAFQHVDYDHEEILNVMGFCVDVHLDDDDLYVLAVF